MRNTRRQDESQEHLETEYTGVSHARRQLYLKKKEDLVNGD